MQIREALKHAAGKLVKSSTPSLDARLLLGTAMAATYEQILLNYDQELDVAQESCFSELVARRQLMEPIAYIIGKQEFYGRDFIVDKNVLIPRPETELLVDIVVNDYNRHLANKSVEILELGSGSGAICISLACEIMAAEITVVDISDAAINISKANAKKHGVLQQINFVKSNWYNNLLVKQYDYIVSNPPYVSRSEKDQMAEETYIFEPDLALYAADNGLSSYKEIIGSAYKYLTPNGKLILEIGYLQKKSIIEILQEHKFLNLNIYQDLAGHDRAIVAKVQNCD